MSLMLSNHNLEQKLVGLNAPLTRVLPPSRLQSLICHCYRIPKQRLIARQNQLSRRSAATEGLSCMDDSNA